jgi:hypothetical protein
MKKKAISFEKCLISILKEQNMHLRQIREEIHKAEKMGGGIQPMNRRQQFMHIAIY